MAHRSPTATTFVCYASDRYILYYYPPWGAVRATRPHLPQSYSPTDFHRSTHSIGPQTGEPGATSAWGGGLGSSVGVYGGGLGRAAEGSVGLSMAPGSVGAVLPLRQGAPTPKVRVWSVWTSCRSSRHVAGIICCWRCGIRNAKVVVSVYSCRCSRHVTQGMMFSPLDCQVRRLISVPHFTFDVLDLMSLISGEGCLEGNPLKYDMCFGRQLPCAAGCGVQTQPLEPVHHSMHACIIPARPTLCAHNICVLCQDVLLPWMQLFAAEGPASGGPHPLLGGPPQVLHARKCVQDAVSYHLSPR